MRHRKEDSESGESSPWQVYGKRRQFRTGDKSLRAGAEINKLAAAAHVSRNTYYAHLRKPEQITVGELRAYIKELNIPKEDILAALYLDQEGGG